MIDLKKKAAELYCSFNMGDHSGWGEQIEQALLEVCNEALEEAAKYIEKKCPIPFPIPCHDKYDFHKFSKEIRSLKKEMPK